MTLYKEGLLDKDYASVKVLGLYVLPPYPIFTSGKKIDSVRSFRGMRIRSPSITVGLALSRLGAIPLGIPLTLIGDTLANDIVDAIAYGWDSTSTTKGAGGKLLIDQVSVAVDVKLAAPALMVVMNRAKWDALPADLRRSSTSIRRAERWSGHRSRTGGSRSRRRRCRPTPASRRSISAMSSATNSSASLLRRSMNGRPAWPNSARWRAPLCAGARTGPAVQGRRQVSAHLGLI